MQIVKFHQPLNRWYSEIGNSEAAGSLTTELSELSTDSQQMACFSLTP